MANKRYSRILSAAKYYGAIDNYIKYVTDATRHNPNVGQGTARAASKVLYVSPFNIDLTTGQKARVSAADPAWTAYGAKFTNYTTATAPTSAANIVKLADYKPSRVVIKSGVSGTGTVKTSHVTGLKYLSYGGKSTSIPFGQQADTDDELAVFNTIRTAIISGATGTLKVTLSPEKF